MSRNGKSRQEIVKLDDKQSERDHRELPIDKVGVRGLRFPIQVRDKARSVQNTVATIGMFVEGSIIKPRIRTSISIRSLFGVLLY